jgi:hypothetical protein
MVYLNLDPDSNYANRGEAFILLRQGMNDEALEKARLLPGDRDMRLLIACIEVKPTSEITTLSSNALSHLVSDPEIRYWTASIESFCGRHEDAIKLLRQAVQGRYCSFPALDKDPLFVPLRGIPEFKDIRAAAIDCQDKLLAYRKKE